MHKVQAEEHKTNEIWVIVVSSHVCMTRHNGIFQRLRRHSKTRRSLQIYRVDGHICCLTNKKTLGFHMEYATLLPRAYFEHENGMVLWSRG